MKEVGEESPPPPFLRRRCLHGGLGASKKVAVELGVAARGQVNY